MKRTGFLRTCLSAGAALTLPVRLLAETVRKFRVGKGFKVDAGKDRSAKPISLLEGDSFMTKVGTRDTDGDIYVFESVRVKEGGPSHHVHFEQDEWWYVLSGQFLIKVGERVARSQSGRQCVWSPQRASQFCQSGRGRRAAADVFFSQRVRWKSSSRRSVPDSPKT